MIVTTIPPLIWFYLTSLRLHLGRLCAHVDTRNRLVVALPQLRQLLQHTLAPQDRAEITETLVDTVYGLSGGIPYWCVRQSLVN